MPWIEAWAYSNGLWRRRRRIFTAFDSTNPHTSNGCRNNFRVCAHRFVVSLNSLGNSQPATARRPNEFQGGTTNGVRIEGSQADVRNQEVTSATLLPDFRRLADDPRDQLPHIGDQGADVGEFDHRPFAEDRFAVVVLDGHIADADVPTGLLYSCRRRFHSSSRAGRGLVHAPFVCGARGEQVAERLEDAFALGRRPVAAWIGPRRCGQRMNANSSVWILSRSGRSSQCVGLANFALLDRTRWRPAGTRAKPANPLAPGTRPARPPRGSRRPAAGGASLGRPAVDSRVCSTWPASCRPTPQYTSQTSSGGHCSYTCLSEDERFVERAGCVLEARATRLLVRLDQPSAAMATITRTLEHREHRTGTARSGGSRLDGQAGTRSSPASDRRDRQVRATCPPLSKKGTLGGFFQATPLPAQGASGLKFRRTLDKHSSPDPRNPEISPRGAAAVATAAETTSASGAHRFVVPSIRWAIVSQTPRDCPTNLRRRRMPSGSRCPGRRP